MKLAKKNLSFQSKINNLKFDFFKNAKWFMLASATIILAGIILFFTIGFNLGIDFTGGTILSVGVKESIGTTVTQTKVNEVLTSNGIANAVFQVSGTESGESISVRYQDISGKTEEQMNDINDLIITEILEELEYTTDEDIALVQAASRIGATASSELILNAFVAVLVSSVLILLYVAFRFEVSFGLSAIISLLHDVFMMCSLTIIFNIEINSSFIAAIITIIGYSINDTIIVYDRMRENLKKGYYAHADKSILINDSIKQTMLRNLYTSLTTLFTITILAFVGIPSIQQFALPIIFGIVAGTYSSILIASPLWAFVNKGKANQKVSTNIEANVIDKPAEVTATINQ
ncbi:MAG: protein translocase subunit SecF [Clostridia bacterium]